MSAVTVIGTGLMGSALARTLANADHQVVAWNRDIAKARALTGVAVEADLGKAIAAGQLIVLAVSDYSVVHSLLTPLVGVLKGRDVVNLVSGSPEEARTLSEFISAAGARYVDGAIEAYPEAIGSVEAIINLSGDPQVWAEYNALLRSLAGQCSYLGHEPQLANVFAVSAGGYFIVAVAAFMEAFAFARSRGIEFDAVEATIDYWTALLGQTLHQSVDAIRKGDYSTDQATLAVYLDGARTCQESMHAVNHRGTIIGAAVQALERASAAGHHDESVFAMFKAAEMESAIGGR
ncbi:NAD(P)-binding domain-containing protein [Nocardia pseudovaccinii]|uniref:NAD(P)-binding domain-containing protein n=1 Tax=Nocardia pseudovaccinii TaxID=189540 RepID=UPI003D8D093E